MISYGIYEIRKTRAAQREPEDLELLDQIRLAMPKTGLIYLCFGIVLLMAYGLDRFGG